MKTKAKRKQACPTRRELFAELREGMAALAESRHGAPRRAKTLLERARKYIGSVKGPQKPKNVAAQAKSLARGIVAARNRDRLGKLTLDGLLYCVPLRIISFLTDFTPLTPLATSTALLISARDLTKPVN